MIIIAFLLPFSLLLFLVNSLHLHSRGLFCFQISLSSHWAGGVSEQLHGAELPARLNHNTRFCSGAYHTEKLFLKNCALHFCVGRPREWVIANIPLYFYYHDGVRSGFYQSKANPMFKYWYICMLVGQNFSGFFLYFHTSSVFYMQTSLIGTLKFEIILLCCFSTSLFHVALPCSFSLPMSVSHNWQKGIDWQLEGNIPMATVCNALQAVVKIKYAWSILTIYHM